VDKITTSLMKEMASFAATLDSSNANKRLIAALKELFASNFDGNAKESIPQAYWRGLVHDGLKQHITHGKLPKEMNPQNPSWTDEDKAAYKNTRDNMRRSMTRTVCSVVEWYCDTYGIDGEKRLSMTVLRPRVTGLKRKAEVDDSIDSAASSTILSGGIFFTISSFLGYSYVSIRIASNENRGMEIEEEGERSDQSIGGIFITL
jgi:hypothetical protein